MAVTPNALQAKPRRTAVRAGSRLLGFNLRKSRPARPAPRSRHETAPCRHSEACYTPIKPRAATKGAPKFPGAQPGARDLCRLSRRPPGAIPFCLFDRKRGLRGLREVRGLPIPGNTFEACPPLRMISATSSIVEAIKATSPAAKIARQIPVSHINIGFSSILPPQDSCAVQQSQGLSGRSSISESSRNMASGSFR